MTHDFENGSTNKNGTYAYELKIDSTYLFNYACKRFAFDQTRYINAHIDYGKMKSNKDRYQRCFLLPGNKIKHYKTDDRKGIFEFNDTLYHTIQINAFDFKNNYSTFEIKCKSDTIKPVLKKLHSKDLFEYNKVNEYKSEEINVELPLNCLYQDVVFKHAKTVGTGKLLADIHQILDDEIPVHQAYTLRIKPKTKALKQKDKLLIVTIDEKGHASGEGGEYENGYVVAKLRNFGKFSVMIDTTAPTIKLINYNKEKSIFKNDKIVLKMSDNLSGIKSYRGTIDGTWILLQHDNKEQTLTYNFDEKLVKTDGEHIFVVTIIDRKGNSKKLTTKFNY
jgi:hypothetical protein